MMNEPYVDIDGILYAIALSRKIEALKTDIDKEDAMEAENARKKREKDQRFADEKREAQERYNQELAEFARATVEYAHTSWWRRRRLPKPVEPEKPMILRETCIWTMDVYLSHEARFYSTARKASERFTKTLAGVHPHCMYHISMEEAISLELRTVERNA